MSQVSVAAPNLKEISPRVLGVANFLRHDSVLKQRQGILNGKRHDFFRVKRAIRALESPRYQKAASKNKDLPTINTRAEALEVFRMLPLNRLAFRVQKLDTQVALKQGLKPVKGVPVLQIMPQQEFGDDMYYVWFHEPVQLITYVYAAAALVSIFAVVMFPLWPIKMRIGVWYLSMGSLGLLGAFFMIAIIRLILFVITYVAVSPGIWLFPNLFEDVGIMDSFIPLWAWQGQHTLPKAEKKKSKNKNKNKKNVISDASSSQQPHQPQPQPPNGMPAQLPPQMQMFLSQMLQQLNARFQQYQQELIAAGKSPEERAVLEKEFSVRETEKLKRDLAAAAQRGLVPPQVVQNVNAAGPRPTESRPVNRRVTLEDDSEDDN
jgi:translocation protein SEC62